MHLLVKKLNLDIFILASPRETLPKVLIKVPPPQPERNYSPRQKNGGGGNYVVVRETDQIYDKP